MTLIVHPRVAGHGEAELGVPTVLAGAAHVRLQADLTERGGRGVEDADARLGLRVRLVRQDALAGVDRAVLARCLAVARRRRRRRPGERVAVDRPAAGVRPDLLLEGLPAEFPLCEELVEGDGGLVRALVDVGGSASDSTAAFLGLAMIAPSRSTRKERHGKSDTNPPAPCDPQAGDGSLTPC
jgi:hypothetical protein